MHYLDFCEKSDTQPVNAASFGKVSPPRALLALLRARVGSGVLGAILDTLFFVILYCKNVQTVVTKQCRNSDA